jgi:glycosyltransferase involved in cell wall biosynthesis
MLVSVIIPCYNVEAYIAGCVHSVMAQTHRELEIICVDNGSMDQTLAILHDLQKQYPIQVLTEPRKGACAARNKGLQAAKGSWIQFLDADDLLMPGKITHQLSVLGQAADKPAFIAGACIKRDIHQREAVQKPESWPVLAAPFLGQSGNTCSNLWSRDAVNAVGGWDEKLGSSQEASLMMKLVLNGGHFLTDPEPLTIIQAREQGQISHRNPADKWKQYIDLRLDYLDRLKSINPKAYKDCLPVLADFLRVSVINLALYDLKAADAYDRRYLKSWPSSQSFGMSRLKTFLIRQIGLVKYLRLANRRSH